MSLRYHIDPEGAMLHVVGEGEITQAERLETMRSWLSHPDFRLGLDTLCDFSDATSAPDSAELSEIVALIKERAASIGNKKLAMIATRPITFGSARQFQALTRSSPLHVQVFEDRETALTWLRGEKH